MNKYFNLEESANYKDKFLIKVNPDNIPDGVGKSGGSLAVLQARLMMMDFPTYLRFCRDIMKAEIIGKQSKYPAIYFTKTPEVRAFVTLLDKRMAAIMHDIEAPYTFAKEDGKIIKYDLDGNKLDEI